MWGLNQIGLAIIIQTFFSSARAANILGYAISMAVQFMCIAINFQIFTSPEQPPVKLLIVPHMAYTRIYYLVSKQCMETICPRGYRDLSPEASKTMFVHSCTALFYIVFGILLNVWLNNEMFGNFGFLKRGRSYDEIPNEELSSKDSSVLHEPLPDPIDPKSYSIVVQGLKKTYFKNAEPFHALNEVSFRLKTGPNGAGKTTLLSILTGLVKADAGDAWIGGFNVRSQLPEVYKRIGVCPQFDLLWEDLTAYEHLIFYARLKGLEYKHLLDSIVLQTLDQVNLREHAHKVSRELSGGQRRRLSLAIALIGTPSVVFLDEPTTGLDPMNRESLWKIIEGAKAATSFIITTHVMQEADYLSDVIGKPH